MATEVSATWIFNRLLDEPERLRSEILLKFEQTRDTSRDDPALWMYCVSLVGAVERQQKAEKVADVLRYGSSTEITVINDHNHIKVNAQTPER